MVVLHPACIGLHARWSIEPVYRRAYTVFFRTFARSEYQAKDSNAINFYFHVTVSYIYMSCSIALILALVESFKPGLFKLLLLVMTGDLVSNWMPIRTLAREQRALTWWAGKTDI